MLITYKYYYQKNFYFGKFEIYEITSKNYFNVLDL